METLSGVKFSLNFNVREPHKTSGKTNLYCVIKVNNRQIKLPIGVNVWAYQWNKRMQMCNVSPMMIIDDRKNNINANKKIFEIKAKGMEIINYLCGGYEDLNAQEIENLIKSEINNIAVMANEQNLTKDIVRTPKATNMLKKAFEIYYQEIKPNAKESTKKITHNLLTAFFDYAKGIGKDKVSMLNQKGINDYKTYLVKKSNEAKDSEDNDKEYISNKQINRKVEMVCRLINKVICVHNEFARARKYIEKVEYIKLEEVKAKNEDKKRRPLNEEEIQKLIECKGLTPKEKEYRDLFLLECYGGYRVSDTHKLFDSKYQTIRNINNNEYMMITPKKEENRNVTAIIWLNENIKNILNKYKDGFKYIKDFGAKYQQNLNNHIKNIAKKAGLNSVERWIDAKGNKCEDYLYNIIASHFGRYTFIYNGLFVWGFTPNELKDFSGHANDKMIEEVYKVYTKDDKFNQANKLVERIQQKEESKKENQDEIIAYQAKENYKLQNKNNQLQTDNDIKDVLSKIYAKNKTIRVKILDSIRRISVDEFLHNFPTDEEKKQIEKGNYIIDLINIRLYKENAYLTDDFCIIQH